MVRKEGATTAKTSAKDAAAQGKRTAMSPFADAPLPGEEPVQRTISRPYRTATELKNKMKTYFAQCESERDGNGVFPDEAGMRIFLRLDHASYQDYKEDPAFAKVFDWAMDMRESWLARRLALDPKMAQAYLNALKQPANGGWVDRRTDTGDKTLRLNIAGIGGKEAGM